MIIDRRDFTVVATIIYKPKIDVTINAYNSCIVSLCAIVARWNVSGAIEHVEQRHLLEVSHACVILFSKYATSNEFKRNFL